MLKCRSHKKQSSKGLSQLQLCPSGIDHCLVSTCRDHPRCRSGHSTNSPQRKTTSSNFPPATSSTCWITPMHRGGKAGWEDRLGCFPQTTQSSCKETPQAMILKRLRAFRLDLRLRQLLMGFWTWTSRLLYVLRVSLLPEDWGSAALFTKEQRHLQELPTAPTCSPGTQEMLQMMPEDVVCIMTCQ